MITPIAELTARERSVGGQVRAFVRVKSGNPNRKSRVILLIHGYNTPESQAAFSFRDFLSILEKQCIGTCNLPVVTFFWPGDATNRRLLSSLSYPFEMGPACDSGRRLAEFVSTLSGPEGKPIEIHVVAHSLGNRVTMEMLDHALKSAHKTVFGTIVMMAAALPVPHVNVGGRFHAAVCSARRRLVLYSRWDETLRKYFPIGETATREGLFFPEAVGRAGRPDRLWDETEEMVGYDHSDYWNGPACCNRAARALGIPVPIPPKRREIPKHRLSPPRQLAFR
jgi:esterase/lipase superfamily enzyme